MSQKLLQQFREGTKALTRYAPAPAPQARRRRKEGTGKAFQVAALKITRRDQIQEAVNRAVAYLWDTLDWLNPWQHEADSEHDQELQHDHAHHLSLHL